MHFFSAAYVTELAVLCKCSLAATVNLETKSGASCPKLMTSLVNISFKFQMLISEIHQYFLLKKCEKLLQCKSFSHFFQQKFLCIWL